MRYLDAKFSTDRPPDGKTRGLYVHVVLNDRDPEWPRFPMTFAYREPHRNAFTFGIAAARRRHAVTVSTTRRR